MGPNGSGKSTLAATLMGSPEYQATAGTVTFRGDDITAWPADERAKAGMFLAFQYPQEIPGVSSIQFLRQALSARKGIDLSILELRVSAMEWMQRLGMDSSFVDRYLNEGFSGGEKKRNEIMQMAILEPALAILDETDSGLDIDALRVVAKGIHEVRARPTRHGRRADHPLPAPARRAGTRPRPRPDGRPHRGDGRDGDRRSARARRLRGVPGRQHERRRRALPRHRHGQGAVPAAAAPARRPADPLPRLGELVAEAAVRDRCDEPLHRDRLRPDQPQRLPPRRRGHRRLRGGTGEGRRLRQRRPRRRDRVHQERHRGAQRRRPGVGPRQPLRRRRRRAHPHGAPRQRRPVAPARRRARHRAALDPADRRRPARPHRPRPSRRRRQGRLGRGDEQRARHAQPRRRAVRRRPRRRRARRRRRLPVRAAQRHRRAGVGRRLRRLLQPQDVRPVGHRRAVGTGRAARRHSPVPRRREHDRRRAPRRVHRRPPSPPSSRPARRRSSRPSGSARRSTSSSRSAWTPCAGTRSR